MQTGRVGDQIRERTVGRLTHQRVPPHRAFGIPRINHDDAVARLDDRTAVGVILRQPGSRVTGVESDRYRCRGTGPERIDEVVQLTETAYGITMSECLPVGVEPVADTVDYSLFRAAMVDTSVGKQIRVTRMGYLGIAIKARQSGHDVVTTRVSATRHLRTTVVDIVCRLVRARIEPGGEPVSLTQRVSHVLLVGGIFERCQFAGTELPGFRQSA